MKLLLGADPEIFVEDKGTPISAHKMIKGNKQNPFLVKSGAVQVDGMALEFNIDPAATSDEWLHNIDTVLHILKGMIPEEYDMSELATAHFDPDYLKAQPRIARMLGCEPDFNAYTGEQNPRPDEKVDFRTAAGHIHLGWGEDMDEGVAHIEECTLLTKQLDIYLGVPSVLLDADQKRRELYGMAGSYRPKEYGMEYRVLSNFWIMSEELIKWVFSQATKAFNDLITQKFEPKDDAFSQYILQANNKKMARERVKKHSIDMPPSFGEIA